MSKVSFEDFLIEGLVQEGSWGKVFAAKRISDGLPLALKFFGYTKSRPNSVDIANEIRSMSQLIGVEGSVQLVGVFKDSPEGLLPGKNSDWHQSYPVIVMEMLNGGDLLTHLATKKHISEKYLADIFRSMVISVSTIHKKGFIHRDIKLCNLMTSSSAAQPPHTKLIDFGFMLDLSTASSRACASPSSFGTVVTDILVGTEGFFAPESLSKCEYSRKSDIWQLGCVLYAMLVGYHPFSTQKRYRSSILSGSYFPMTTADWQEISSQGKDLVSKLLQVKPCDRLELEDILKHPWIASRSSEASPSSWETGLGEGYHERMKLLASHRLQYLPLGMSQSDADTKLSQLVTESAEKRQKVDHSEGKTEADGCELRSVSPVQLRRAESEKKGDPQSAAAVKPSGDRSCRSSPSLEKQADEELLSNCGGK